jgi:hypothetical protein
MEIVTAWETVSGTRMPPKLQLKEMLGLEGKDFFWSLCLVAWIEEK